MKIGFIGLGTMGGRMAASLRAAGHELCVNDIRREAVDPHVAAGATAKSDAREVGEASEVIFTSLFDDRYGVGGTFDTSNNGISAGTAGDWGGLYAGIAGSMHLDHTLFAFAGGITRVTRIHGGSFPVQ